VSGICNEFTCYVPAAFPLQVRLTLKIEHIVPAQHAESVLASSGTGPSIVSARGEAVRLFPPELQVCLFDAISRERVER
jgi:hypothetical protein